MLLGIDFTLLLPVSHAERAAVLRCAHTDGWYQDMQIATLANVHGFTCM